MTPVENDACGDAMMANVARVFVSATSTDLKSYRLAVRDTLLDQNALPVVQDHFPPDHETVTEMLRQVITPCDAVICLLGVTYGAEPKDRPKQAPRRSYTQMEHDIARELGKPVFVFVTTDDCQLDSIPQESKLKKKLQVQHRDRLTKSDKLYYQFASIDALKQQVARINFAELSAAKQSRDKESGALELRAALGADVPGITEKYRRQLRDQYSRIPTLDPDRPLDLSGDLIPLRLFTKEAAEILRESMDEADVVIARLQKNDQAWDDNQVFEHARPVAELLREYKRLIVLGDAGSGKTTLLQHLTYVNASVDDESQGLVPIFVHLADFVTKQQSLQEHLIDLLQRRFAVPEAGDWLAQLLRQGRVALLLDGLDEVEKESGRRGIAEEVSALLSRDCDSNNVVCVTSRIAGFRHRFPQFTLVAIDQFSRDEALQFVRNFTDDPERAERIVDLIESNPLRKRSGITPLRRVSRTPLFLSVLTMILKRSPTQELPSRRVDVYRRCIEVLLHEWLELKGLDRRQEQLDYLTLEVTLTAAALHFQRQGKRVFPAKELAEAIAPALKSSRPDPVQRVVDDLISARGIITKCDHDLYQFYHLTFQEYLCARALIQHEDGLSEVLTHVTDPRWEEVIKTYAALHHSPEEICTHLLQASGLVLCAKALEEMAAELQCLRFILGFCLRHHGTTSAGGDDHCIGYLESLQDEGLMREGDASQIAQYDSAEARKWLSIIIVSAVNDNLRFAVLELAEAMGPGEKKKIVSTWQESRRQQQTKGSTP